MAKTDYSPEIKSAMSAKEKADDARDKKRGIKEGSPQDIALDKQAGIPEQPGDIPRPSGGGGMGQPHMGGAGPHAVLASGIAHAILAHARG